MPLLDPVMMRQVGQAMGHGMNLGVYVCASLGLGWAAGKYLGTGNIGYFVFVPLGFGLGVYRLIKALGSSKEPSE